MSAPVIFDLDGTLVDSAGVCVAILNDMLADRGSVRTIHPATARPWFSTGGAKMVAALLGEDCGDPDAEIVEFRRRYAERPTPSSSLFPGVREGLRALATSGRRLAICSNKPQALCDKVLADLHLSPLFDVVVGARPGYRAKPATDLLNLTLLHLRVAPEDCVYVGDSEVDYAVAAAAAVPFRFVTYGYAAAGWDGEGMMRFDRFDDLVADLLSGAPAQAGAQPRRQAIGSAETGSPPSRGHKVSRAA